MTGTSVDGCDVAVLDFSKPPQESFVGHLELPFPKDLAKRVHRAIEEPLVAKEWSLLSRDLGKFYAEVAVEAQKKWHFSSIAIHGQTVCHLPSEQVSVQLGDPLWLAQALGCPVYYDFRSADLLWGGEGAPLVPLFDRWFLKEELPCLALNIGGVANLSVLGEPFLGYDIGPGNCWLDGLCRLAFKTAYDKDGERAKQGHLLEDLYQELLAWDYFSQDPPKSTGRELFTQAYLVDWLERFDPLDLLATLVELSATLIAREALLQARKIGCDKVYMAGGGVKNSFLLERIQALAPELTWLTFQELGMPIEAREAAAFAYLGWCRDTSQPLDLRSITGSRCEANLLGRVCTPSSYL